LCVGVVRFRTQDFGECKAKLIERGEKFTENSEDARQNIASKRAVPSFSERSVSLCFDWLGLTDSFIRDGATILAYSFSRVVLHALLESVKKGKRYFNSVNARYS
jgi:translation initiation factor 2B subunit (eIF-2B alpha/beta/delta family)